MIDWFEEEYEEPYEEDGDIQCQICMGTGTILTQEVNGEGILDIGYENCYKCKGKGVVRKKECEECGQPYVLRKGPYGYFYGCSAYPKCKGTRQLTNAEHRLLRMKLKKEEREIQGCEGNLTIKMKGVL